MDIKEIGDQIVLTVKTYVGRAVEAINMRLVKLEEKLEKFIEHQLTQADIDYFLKIIAKAVDEAKASLPIPRDGKDGEAGKDADPEQVKALVRQAVDALPKPKDGEPGKDADPAQVAVMVKQAVDALPKPKDGEPGKDADPAQVAVMVKQAVDALPKPKDGEPGKDADPAQVAVMVKQAVDALPKPKDGEPGKDADPAQVAAMVKQAVDTLPKPKDGEPGKDANPAQVAAMVKQAVDALPKPKDGEPGKDGKSIKIEDINPLLEAAIARYALEFERRAADVLQRAIDNMPEPKAGKDGFSADDLQIEALDGGRTIRVKLMQGEREIVRELPLAVPLDRGVYKSGMKAEAGDGVTYGGSWWIAQRKTDTIPGKSEDWRLAVKRGQDGKDLR